MKKKPRTAGVSAGEHDRAQATMEQLAAAARWRNGHPPATDGRSQDFRRRSRGAAIAAVCCRPCANSRGRLNSPSTLCGRSPEAKEWLDSVCGLVILPDGIGYGGATRIYPGAKRPCVASVLLSTRSSSKPMARQPPPIFQHLRRTNQQTSLSRRASTVGSHSGRDLMKRSWPGSCLRSTGIPQPIEPVADSGSTQ